MPPFTSLSAASSGEPSSGAPLYISQCGFLGGSPARVTPITSLSAASSGGAQLGCPPLHLSAPVPAPVTVRGSSLLKSMKAGRISLLDHCLSLAIGAWFEHSYDYYLNHKRIYSTMCQKPSKASNVFNSSAVCNNCQLLILRYSLSAITELARGIVGVKPRILASKSVSFIILDCLSSSLHLC